MLFLGHIAASLLIADVTHTDRAASIAGSILPDVVDKTGGLLGLMPSRWLGHGLPFFALSAVAACILLPGKQRRAFVGGYAGHLVCDLWAGSKVPWFAPFERRRPATRNRWPKTPRKWLIYLLPELIGGVLTWRMLTPRPVTATSTDLAKRI